jgi:hypothetical protein
MNGLIRRGAFASMLKMGVPPLQAKKYVAGATGETVEEVLTSALRSRDAPSNNRDSVSEQTKKPYRRHRALTKEQKKKRDRLKEELRELEARLSYHEKSKLEIQLQQAALLRVIKTEGLWHPASSFVKFCEGQLKIIKQRVDHFFDLIYVWSTVPERLRSTSGRLGRLTERSLRVISDLEPDQLATFWEALPGGPDSTTLVLPKDIKRMRSELFPQPKPPTPESKAVFQAVADRIYLVTHDLIEYGLKIDRFRAAP